MNDSTQKSRLWIALCCIHIFSVLYLIIGFGFPSFIAWIRSEFPQGKSPQIDMDFLGTQMLVTSLVIVVALEILAMYLRRRSYNAWICGLVVCGLCATSPFLPVGVLGLWALLSEGTRMEFGSEAMKPLRKKTG